MKKFITLLSLCTLASCLLTAAPAVTPSKVQVMADFNDTFFDANFEYTVLTVEGTNGTVSVGRKLATIPSGSVTIPALITEGKAIYSVTTIGQEAFSWCKDLTDITIPDTVTEIGDEAFSWCSNLRNITIPDSVTHIGNEAFDSGDKLSPILLSTGGKILAYYSGDNAQQEYTIPDTVTYIANSAFKLCKNLTNITIPESVTRIGSFAFVYCRGLRSLSIPKSVTDIGVNAFSECDGLTELVVDRDNPHFSSLEGVLFDKNQTTLIRYPCAKIGAYTIPESVTRIADYAFANCEYLQEVTIPNSVTDIGEYAFSDCISLTNITIPDSVTRIGSGAFRWCDFLASATIPEGVTHIGDEAFRGCSLTSVTIPDSVTHVGIEAFRGCTKLASVVIGKKVPSIKFWTFDICENLTNVEIGEGVTKIENSAFSRCTGLTSITIPDNVTCIGDFAFSECDNLRSVVMGNGLNYIGGVAFDDCNRLEAVYFKGYAPKLGVLDDSFYEYQKIARPLVDEEVFCSDPILYYIEGASGWTTPTWNGYRTAIWGSEEPPALSYEIEGGRLILTYGAGQLEESDDRLLWNPVEGAQGGIYEVNISTTGKKFYRVIQ